MFKSYSLLLFLLAGASVFGQNFKFGKVSEEEVLEKNHPLDKNAAAAVLYKYQRTYYNYSQGSGFQLITEVQERIKIYNKDGFDWATEEISIYEGKSDEDVSGIKGITYNMVNGKLEEEKLDKDDIYEEENSKYRRTVKFAMPAVKEGSVVEFEYRIISPYISTIDKTNLQYTIPINKIEVSVTIPEYFIFSVYNNPKAPFYAKVERSSKAFSRKISETVRTGTKVVSHSRRSGQLSFNQNVYTINREDIPALKQEPHVDYLQNYAAFLKWELQYTKFPNSTIENYSHTWEGVTNSIYKDVGFGRELDRTSFFKDDVDVLLAGISNPMQKTAKIFQFVKEKLKWNNYAGFVPEEGTKGAYKEGSGNVADINLLLTAMLKYAGLPANPVLVSTPDNGIPLFPTRGGFNYLITAVEFPDGLILLDASDRTAGLNELPKRARNWQGRIIREEGGSEWVSVFPSRISENIITINLEIKPDGFKGGKYQVLTGLYAKNFREENLSESTEDLKEAISKRFSKFTVSDIKIEGLNLIGEDIKEDFKFKTSHGFEAIGDKLYFKPMLFEALSENPFKAEERTYPVIFDFPSNDNVLINIMLPEDYMVISAPESQIVQLKENAGEFRFTVLQNKSFLRIESEIIFNESVFTIQDYEYLKKFYDNIIKKHSEAIVLEKESEDGLEERAESGR